MRTIYSMIFITICGLIACCIDGTVGEARWYLGGFVVGFIASIIQGHGK